MATIKTPIAELSFVERREHYHKSLERLGFDATEEAAPATKRQLRYLFDLESNPEYDVPKRVTEAARRFILNVVEISRVLDGVKATYKGEGEAPAKFSLPGEPNPEYFGKGATA